jgi:hypothetical protein
MVSLHSHAAGTLPPCIPQSDTDRLLDAAYRALPLLPEEIRQQVAQMLTPEAMAAVGAIAAVFIGSQFLGFGEVLDVVAAGAAELMVGLDGIKSLMGFARYYELAIHAQNDGDIDAAAKSFADAVLSAVAAVGWGRLGKWMGSGARQTAALASAETAEAAKLARWKNYIDALEFKVPRDQGMLWSKLDQEIELPKIGNREGLVWLEKVLKKNGFFEIYERDFGSTKNAVTKEIWKMVSRKYVQSLEGEVKGFVHRAEYYKHINENAERLAKAAGMTDEMDIHAFRKAINPNDPVLVTEVDEIRKILLSNPRITVLTLIDEKTGEAFGYLTREVLESLQRLEQR